MNTYLIQQKIESFSNIYEHDIFSLNDYKFEQWEYKHFEPLENAWLVEKTIDANNINEAMKIFSENLFPILNRASFVSQCGMQYQVNSFFVIKTNDNAEGVFFLQALSPAKEANLSFQSREKESLDTLMHFENEVVFDFLAVANLSLTNHSRLVPMILAIEALAGEKEVVSVCPNPNCKDNSRKYPATDKVKVKEILGNELFSAIYDFKTGLRNKLFHGKVFEIGDGKDYAQKIYEKIISYFNTTYKTKINEEVASAPRNGMGKYNRARVWAKPKTNNTYSVDLRTLLPLFNEKSAEGFVKKDNSNFNQNFENIDGNTYFISTY